MSPTPPIQILILYLLPVSLQTFLPMKKGGFGDIRTSDSTGYYVDIFRLNLMTNDYIYHNLGDTLSLEGGGTLLQLHPADAIEYPVLDADFKADNSGKNYGDGYTYFKTPRKLIGIPILWQSGLFGDMEE